VTGRRSERVARLSIEPTAGPAVAPLVEGRNFVAVLNRQPTRVLAYTSTGQKLSECAFPSGDSPLGFMGVCTAAG
jgi:hypothetical protein